MNKIIFAIAISYLSLIPSIIWGQNIEYVGSTGWSIGNDLAVVGNYAYCAFTNGLEIIDISNPISPAITSRLFFTGQGQQIEVAGQYAYITAGTTGLRIVDISNATNPVLVGNTLKWPENHYSSFLRDITEAGQILNESNARNVIVVLK